MYNACVVSLHNKNYLHEKNVQTPETPLTINQFVNVARL